MSVTQKVIIYGVGIRGKRLCRWVEENQCSMEIAAVVDSNPQLWGECCYGYTISDPSIVLKTAVYPVCIAVAEETAVATINDALIEKYRYPHDLIWSYLRCLVELWLSVDGPTIAGHGKEAITGERVSVICDLSHGLILGGVESWTRILLTALSIRGWQNLLIYSENRSKRMGYASEWSELSKLADFSGSNLEPLVQSLGYQGTAEYLIQHCPCVIIANFPEMLCIACAVKRLYPKQVRVICVIHNGQSEVYDEYNKMKDDVDVFVGVSQDIQQAMIARGVEPERMLLMNIPFECDEIIQRSYALDSSQPIRIGFAGRLEVDQKRMDLLLRLIELLELRTVNYRLEIAGSGSYEAEMHVFIEEHHLEHRVFMLGHLLQEDIPEFWRRQDIAINISDFEGWCISIAEAMGNGAVPVVTDVVGIARDVIRNGRSGFRVPIGDYEAMADKIEQLAKDRDLLLTMGQAAHADIYPTSLMEPHVQFWEELLSRNIESIKMV